MNISIIKHQIGNSEVNSVSARDLHRELDVRKDFTSWFKAQIKRGMFDENIDYIVFTQKGENLKGGRPTTEYVVTIDTAKHIALMSGTQKGKEVRNYFIEIEKQYKSKPQTQKEYSPQKIQTEISAIQNIFDNTNFRDSKKIDMLKKLYEKLGLETCYFPKQIILNRTISLTKLLEKFEIDLTAQELNQKIEKLKLVEKIFLDENGYLWFITEKGEEFGENEKYEDRTTPKYFENKFQELLELVSEQ